MIDTLNSDMCALLFLMILRPPRSTRTDTLFPDTTRFRSHAAPLGVGIVAALERDVDERVGDGVDLRLPHQRHQLGRIVVVHGMHGGEMGAADAALQPQALSLVGEALGVPRAGILALVAAHVPQPAAPGRDSAKLPHHFPPLTTADRR